MRKRILVVCPGRGSYTNESLGYLDKYKESQKTFIEDMDRMRSEEELPTVSEMDSAEKFKVGLHTKGEHASPLIFSCAACDFFSIDRKNFEIVAVAGNSMGWYLSLAFTGVLDRSSAFHVIQTMGGMMKDELIGGQIIYPIVDEHWKIDLDKWKRVLDQVEGRAHISILLGGYVVIGGEEEVLRDLLKTLPKEGDYPFKLMNHGAFHTPLLQGVSHQAFEKLSLDLFRSPQIPLIDGRGGVWRPLTASIEKLREYTFGEQVLDTYDFTRSIEVGLKEFAPDHVVILGPGNTLGGVVGQVMIKNAWHNLKDKEDFIQRQKSSLPLLYSMGLPSQRKLVVTN